MVNVRPSAPAVALFGAISSDRLAALAAACTADARQDALDQVAAVSRIRAVYGMCFSTSVN